MMSKRILNTLILFGGIYLIVFGSLGLIIEKYGLQYRSWMFLFTFFIFAIWVLFLLILGIQKLRQQKKIPYIIGLFITVMLGLIIEFGALWTGLWKYSNGIEHVVERDGIKMVAVVNAFLDVNVQYYAYKNFFVMEKDILISEWYGSGGYDPFEKNPMPQPRKTYILKKK